MRTHQRLLQTTKALERLHLERENAKIALARQQETETTLKREQQVLEVEREALGEHDVFKAEKEKAALILKQQENAELQLKKTNQLTSSSSREGKLKDQIGKLELKEQHALSTIQEELEELDSLAEESAFLNHEVAADEFNREFDQTFSFALWKKEALDYQSLLENVMKVLRQESGAKERYQEADLALSETKKSWDEEQYQEKKWADVLQEEQSSWVAQLFEWQSMNQELRFQDIELQTLALRARSFPESVNQSTLREPLLQATDRARDQIRRELLNVKHEQEQILKEVKAKSEAIEVWRQRKDPEPARHDLTNQARKILQDIKVPFVSFYSAVEFHDHVPQATRERLESALKEMGILDALILPEHVAVKTSEQEQALQNVPVHDRVLKPAPQILAHTLADNLYPTPVEGSKVQAGDIENILLTILVADGQGESNTSLFNNGSYRIGALKGHAPLAESALYIGKEARRQLRLREIKKLEDERELLNQQVLEQENRLQSLNQKSDKLEEEYQTFPSEQSMQEAWDIIYKARQKIEILEKDVQRKNEVLLKALEIWRDLKAQVKELSRTLTLPLDELSYVKAHAEISSYREGLTTIESLYQQVHSTRREQSAVLSHLENTSEAVDELRGEMNELRDQAQTFKDLLIQVEQRLQDLGADEIRERIHNVIKRLNALPSEIETCIQQISTLNRDLKDYDQKMLENERDLTLTTQLQQGWANVFQAEETLQTSFDQVMARRKGRDCLEIG